MGIEKHRDFLRQYDTSMLMAVDQLRPGETTAIREFFDDIYVSFTAEDEQTVLSAVQDADRFTVVVAPLGGGKSTIVYWALQNMRSQSRDYFIFDFKREISSLYPMKGLPQEKARFMHDRFKDALMNAFLPTLAKKLDFAFHTLQRFFIHERHQMEVKWSQRHPALRSDEESATVRSLFLSDSQSQEVALKLISERLTCAQMILALKDTLGLSNFLLVLENVDKCPVIDQPVLFSVAIDMNHEGLGEFGTMVTLRNKNLMRFEEAGSDGDVIEVVSITSDYSESARPVRLNPPTSEHAARIVEKRQVHALKKAPSAVGTQSAGSAEIFRQLQKHVNAAMVEERFQNLSNHSYRRMLVMHDGFVRYLFRLVEADAIKIEQGQVDLCGWKTRSYLYRWLYAANNPDHRFLLDIVSRHQGYNAKSDDLPMLCDIELVVLAWLVNNHHHSLTMSDLSSGFRRLSIGSEFIREGIYRLYPRKALLRHVELGDSEERITPEGLKSPDCRLKVTPLGTEFVQYTITIFEFLHQCLAYPVITNADATEMLAPVELDMDSKINRVYEFLKIMGRVHCETLKEFRESWHGKNEDWESYYRRTFCIREQLILERIAYSHLAYFRNQFPTSFDKWRSQYYDLIDEYLRDVKSSHDVSQVLYGL